MTGTPERLTSVKNPLIKILRSLKDKKGRDEHGMMLVEGEKLIVEALDCRLVPGFLLYDERRPPDAAVIRRLIEAGCEVHPSGDNVIAALTDTKSPQGSVAAFRLPEPMAAFPDRLIALDDVQDPGNVGTIWRTADAAGLGGLILSPACADPFSPKVQRAAMGASFRLPVAVAPFAETLMALKRAGFSVIASALAGAPFYARWAVNDKYVLVVGNEARGVSDEVLRLADITLKLPMRGGAESLNVAVAAGIMMYELTRDLPG